MKPLSGSIHLMINTYPLQHLRCLAYIEATILNKMDGKLIPQFKDGKMAGGGGGGEWGFAVSFYTVQD